MSRILDALENAQADARRGGARHGADLGGSPLHHPEVTRPARLAGVSMEEEMVSLRQRLDALFPDRPGRAIEFIGSREGEGTSTVVDEFARHSVTAGGQRVLILEMVPPGSAEGRSGDGSGGAVVDATPLLAGRGTLHISPLPQELLAPRTAQSQGPDALWARIRSRYDLVLIDALPATSSPLGLAVSRQVDGVVLVLAAEETRWPVAERVKQSIERSGGRVLGVVFNKRQYHIPGWIYKRL